MRKWAILFSGIMELIGGIIVYIQPSWIFPVDETSTYIFQLYGLTMSVIGILCIAAYRYYESTPFYKILFLTMMFFHGVITMKTYSLSADSFQWSTEASITHGVMFIFFVVAYMSDIKKDDE